MAVVELKVGQDLLYSLLKFSRAMRIPKPIPQACNTFSETETTKTSLGFCVTSSTIVANVGIDLESNIDREDMSGDAQPLWRRCCIQNTIYNINYIIYNYGNIVMLFSPRDNSNSRRLSCHNAMRCWHDCIIKYLCHNAVNLLYQILHTTYSGIWLYCIVFGFIHPGIVWKWNVSKDFARSSQPILHIFIAASIYLFFFLCKAARHGLSFPSNTALSDYFPMILNPSTSRFDISSPGGWRTVGGMWRNYSAAAAAARTVMEPCLVCLMWRATPSLYAAICSVHVCVCVSLSLYALLN